MTFGWFSVFHILMIAALLIPNGMYMLQNKQVKNKCTSRCMNVLEQIGRYGCMLLMILSVKGGTSDGLLAVYEAGSLMCLLLYVLLWRHLLKNKAVYAAFVPIAVLAVLFALLSPVIVVLAVGLTGIVYVMMRASGCTCRKSWICMALAIVPAVRHYPACLAAHGGSCHICSEPSVCHVVQCANGLIPVFFLQTCMRCDKISK